VACSDDWLDGCGGWVALCSLSLLCWRCSSGISLLLLEREMPGISVRKMKTQFDTTHGTTFINLDDVKVPVRNLIGQEGVLPKLLARRERL
jgi:hypothetical protein